MRASTDYRKVLVVAFLGLFFCTVAATVTLAQEAPASREGVAFDLPKQEQPVVYRKQNPAAAFSLRNNLAWDATGSLNLGFEIPLGRHASIGSSFGFKSWDRFLFWESFSYLDDDNPTNSQIFRLDEQPVDLSAIVNLKHLDDGDKNLVPLSETFVEDFIVLPPK